MQDRTPFCGESTKNQFIYTRIDAALSLRIDAVKDQKGFKNKSQTIRRLISWVFENTLEDKIQNIESQDESLLRDQFIYTRIENHLLEKIDCLKEKKKFNNRSQTIRRIIHCAFEQGVDSA